MKSFKKMLSIFLCALLSIGILPVDSLKSFANEAAAGEPDEPQLLYEVNGDEGTVVSVSWGETIPGTIEDPLYPQYDDYFHYICIPETSWQYVEVYWDSEKGEYYDLNGNPAYPGIEYFTVTGIGERAFADTNRLTGVSIPNSIKNIGEAAFANTPSLTEITVDDENPVYHSVDNCLIETASKTLIAGCKNSIIPDDGSVISIADYAFSGCTGLTSITIPDSVTSIGNNAFANCSGLTSVTIPNSVTSIDFGAFFGCISLNKVNISDIAAWCNISFVSLDSNPLCYAHNLYLNNELVTDLVIPDGVTSIGNYAFYNCTGLTSIVIPDSVTSIGYGAFSGCTGLTSIAIPDSVTSIESRAFANCTSLKTVYYSGTQEQKNQIYVGSNNAELTNAEWICNCTAERAEKCETLRKVYLKTAIQKKSGAKPTDSSYNLRLISMLDGLNDYSEVGFYITIAGYNDGENDEPIKYSTDTVYTSFLNGGTRVKASDYGAEYFTIVNMTVPNEYYSANIKIKPYIVFTDGSEFSGNEINTTVSKYVK